MKTNDKLLSGLTAVALLFCGLAGACAARAETSEVRIGLQYGLVYLPIVVASEEQLFDKQARARGLPGLKVTLHRFSGSTGMTEAVLSRSVDFGSFGVAGALIVWDKTRGPLHVKSLAGLSVITYTLFTNRQDVNSIRDFSPNSKIAVPAFNSPQAILLRVAAARDLGGTDKADALMATLPHPDATAALIAGRTIGGYFATPPFTLVLERSPAIRKVLVSGSLMDGKEATAATLAGPQSFFDANPQVTRALLAGLVEACDLIRMDPKRAAAIYLKSESVPLGVDDVTKIIADGTITYQTEPQEMLFYARHMVEQGLLRKMPEKVQDVFFQVGD
jgi:NitT/TauT family transport system substrate-binding protein